MQRSLQNSLFDVSWDPSRYQNHVRDRSSHRDDWFCIKYFWSAGVLFALALPRHRYTLFFDLSPIYQSADHEAS